MHSELSDCLTVQLKVLKNCKLIVKGNALGLVECMTNFISMPFSFFNEFINNIFPFSLYFVYKQQELSGRFSFLLQVWLNSTTVIHCFIVFNLQQSDKNHANHLKSLNKVQNSIMSNFLFNSCENSLSGHEFVVWRRWVKKQGK